MVSKYDKAEADERLYGRLIMPALAFITSKQYPDLTASDRIAAEALERKNIRVVPAIWDDESVDWKMFNAIVIRSPWDYYLCPEKFLQWIRSLEDQRLPVWNPPEILRWNMNKRYLLDLERKGVIIPRTYFLDNKQSFDAFSLRTQLGLDEIVVKPVVSASGWNTWRCFLKTFSEEDRRRLNDVPEKAGVMVQEFMPEVVTDGEWSLIFFGKQFSHAVKKFPGSGEFRVQEEFGGRYCFEPQPPKELIRQAQTILSTIQHPLLYARVDGVVSSKKFVLMELELLEPSLFFDVHPAGVDPFCQRMMDIMHMY